MSSSSQLSRVSWQPSQEANFQTASFGRPFSVTSHLPESEQTSDLRIGQHRAVDADEQLAVLAVPAQAYPAAHVALEGDPDTAGANAAPDERQRRMPHHDLGTADEGERGHRVEPGARDELRHQTDATLPRLPPIVDGDEDFHPLVLPLLQLVDEEQLFRASGAIEQHHPSIVLPVGEHFEHRGPQWRQPDAARDEDHVPTVTVGNVPAGAVWPTDAEWVAYCRAREWMLDGADIAHRVLQRAVDVGVTADGDRH